MEFPSYVPLPLAEGASPIIVDPFHFPSLASPTPGLVGGENVILDQVTLSSGLVADYSEKVIEIADALDNILQEESLPAAWDTVLDGVIINPVPPIDDGDIPVPGAIVLPGFEGITFPTCGTLVEAPTISLDYTPPTDPTDVDPTLSHTPATYTSDMWLSLFTKVQNDIDNGGSGLDADVEAAIHARDADRKFAANEKAYTVATANLTSRALSFPQFAMANLEARMAGEILRQEHASSNEIVIVSSDLAQKNTQFAVTTGLDIEKLLRAFHEVIEKLTLGAKQAVAEFIMSKYRDKTAAFREKWQAITAEMRAKVDAANVVIVVNQSIIDKYKVDMQGATAEGDLISKERESIGQLAGVEADVYKSRVAARDSWNNALSENQKAQLQKSELDLRKAEAELKFILESHKDLTTIRKDILTQLGGIFAQVMAAALNTVSTSVGHTTSRTANVSESTSHSEDISERYSVSATIGENHGISHKGQDIE